MDLFNQYHPFEIDSNLVLDLKNKKMLDWWVAHLDLLVKSGITKNILQTIIDNNKLVLRDKTIDFFSLLRINEIPLLIFSAGFGNLIEFALEKENCFFENMSIISNFFIFDVNGLAKGYNPQVIHSFNKGEIAIKNDLHYSKIALRKNIILLGDSLGDLSMADGMNHNIKITIGFYNDLDLNQLNEYKKQFDIVITNDSDMAYVNELLNKILN